jgi:sugar O-acyltransferase (sialic acid O-acetyltransferase NeuD family)
MRDLLFWGATGQAKVLHELIYGTDMSLKVLIDNSPVNSPIPGVPVLIGEQGLDAWLEQRGGVAGLGFAVAVGGGRGRERLMLMELLLSRGLKAETLVHRTAFVAHGATIGIGSQILAQSAICANAKLGRGVIINTSASVDHDCELGDGVHLAPGARLAGEIRVGAGAFIGTGAVILPKLTIGHDAIIGAGAVVTKNVEAGVTVIGNPAQRKI